MVLAGISGCTSGSSVAADCAMIFCGQDVSPDDTSKRVYVRSSRNCLQTKIFTYSWYDVICTVCPWQMLVGD